MSESGLKLNTLKNIREKKKNSTQSESRAYDLHPYPVRYIELFLAQFIISHFI